ncbi:hypothetical protein ACQPXH_21080 [Nocardia sp. CA-135953]|uniref:hypothetical protein n=1 Tax=Nocardia sp. CA-135953 TaxID=3239978 RepID=UPI003D95C1CC
MTISFLDHPALQYRAPLHIAERFAEAVRRAGVEVRIDAKLYDGLRPLPCARLWTS